MKSLDKWVLTIQKYILLVTKLLYNVRPKCKRQRWGNVIFSAPIKDSGINYVSIFHIFTKFHHDLSIGWGARSIPTFLSFIIFSTSIQYRRLKFSGVEYFHILHTFIKFFIEICLLVGVLVRFLDFHVINRTRFRDFLV